MHAQSSLCEALLYYYFFKFEIATIQITDELNELFSCFNSQFQI